jgi:hypothetical protein
MTWQRETRSREGKTGEGKLQVKCIAEALESGGQWRNKSLEAV